VHVVYVRVRMCAFVCELICVFRTRLVLSVPPPPMAMPQLREWVDICLYEVPLQVVC
jgi:hypothetical protein